MRQTLFGGLLVAALVVAMGVAPDSVVAQGKEKDKVDKDKEKAKDKAAKGAVIEIGKGKDDKFRFFVRDHDGKLLAMSGPGGFASVKDAEAAIDKLREAVAKGKVVMKEDKDDK
jgi:hypothetical protein